MDTKPKGFDAFCNDCRKRLNSKADIIDRCIDFDLDSMVEDISGYYDD